MTPENRLVGRNVWAVGILGRRLLPVRATEACSTLTSPGERRAGAKDKGREREAVNE